MYKRNTLGKLAFYWLMCLQFLFILLHNNVIVSIIYATQIKDLVHWNIRKSPALHFQTGQPCASRKHTRGHEGNCLHLLFAYQQLVVMIKIYWPLIYLIPSKKQGQSVTLISQWSLQVIIPKFFSVSWIYCQAILVWWVQKQKSLYLLFYTMHNFINLYHVSWSQIFLKVKSSKYLCI